MNVTTIPAKLTHDSGPWWRYGQMWMVVGGPLIVVVASVATYVIAVKSADGLVVKSPAEQTVETQVASEPTSPGMLPSLVGRNHSATTKRSP